MVRQRTTPILVLAILHLVGGGLGLIASLCGCAGLFMANSLGSISAPTFPARPGQPAPPPPPPSPADTMKFYNDNVPGYRAFTIGSVALSMLLDIMLISGGIGLLNMQPWARWLSLVYAPISILVRIATFIYNLALVMPATNKLYAQNPAMAGMSSFVNVGTGIGLFVSLLFVIYPIAVVIILLMPSTAAAFRGDHPAGADDLSSEDYPEDDRWREPPRATAFDVDSPASKRKWPDHRR